MDVAVDLHVHQASPIRNVLGADQVLGDYVPELFRTMAAGLGDGLELEPAVLPAPATFLVPPPGALSLLPISFEVAPGQLDLVLVEIPGLGQPVEIALPPVARLGSWA